MMNSIIPPIERTLKNRLKCALLRKNIRISRAVDAALLAEFLTSLRPITTNRNLIRVGCEGDGGYLVPDDLENINVCFSPGVAETAHFELDLTKRGIKCFLADYSVDGPPIHNELIHFEKKYLGPTEDSIHTTLDNWVERNAPDQSDFILQMDIEGGEYGVILDTSRETLKKFRIAVIEFHGLDTLCDKLGFVLIDLTFKKILRDFEIVHMHPNNCFKPIIYKEYEIPLLMEFTFLRKDRISSRRPTLVFPHKLDRANFPDREDFPVPRCWFDHPFA
jgi:hypothetical protein